VSTSQKGSIELVGEFFEVRAQVDCDLTTVSWVDRLLGLIKNLGRHTRAVVHQSSVDTDLYAPPVPRPSPPCRR
jgi:hypothetical protein